MKTIQNLGLLTLLCLILYAPGLASLPILDRDEPHFAQASRQMLEDHNFWQINFQFVPRHLKPPGIYWLQAAAVKIFSNAESPAIWPYRLPSAVGAWLAVLFTFGFLRRPLGETKAILAAVILACSALVIIEAHLAVTDAMLLATMTAMQLALARIYYHSHRQQSVGWCDPAVFWLALALGILIKGITPLVAALTILGLVMSDRQVKWLKNLHWAWGVSFVLLFTAAWLVPISMAGGGNFLWDMIHNDVLPKISGGQQSHGMPPGFLTLIFTLTFWPASLFIVPAIVQAWRCRKDALVRFLLAWIIPTWIFFELVPTKLPEYLLPIYPAIALLISFFLISPLEQRLNKWATAILMLQQALWLAATIGLVAAAIVLGGWAWLTATLVIASALFLLINFYRSKKVSYAILGIILGSCAFVPIWQISLPGLQKIWISQRIVSLINQQATGKVTEQNPLIAVSYQEPSLVFLLGKKRVFMLDKVQVLNRLQAKSQSLYLISQQDLPIFSGKIIGKVSGFQYNGGRSVIVYIVSPGVK